VISVVARVQKSQEPAQLVADTAAASAGSAPPKKKRRSSRAQEAAATEHQQTAGPAHEGVPSSGAPDGSASRDVPPTSLPVEQQPAQQPAQVAEDVRSRQWYLSSMASCFDQEIDALHEAGTAPPAGVLLRALSAGAALLTPAERRIAAAMADLRPP